jgi:hypothetical protein
MNPRPLPVVCLLFLATADLPGQDVARLSIDADYAIVELDESPASRRYVQLPNLEFPLRIEPVCPPGASTDSVSISVADTRGTFRAGAFGEQEALETIFRVPRQQIGPLPVEHFCTTDDSDADRRIVRIPDVLTAQASLRCVDESRQFIFYDVIRLHVELRCRRGGPAAGVR